MNYKKATAMGALCALGMLCPKNSKAYGYVVSQPVYTTPVVYTTAGVNYATPVTYTTVTTTPGVYSAPVIYGNAYYNGYYDAMSRRWWYQNEWYNYRPPMCPPPRYNYGYHSYAAPHYNHCAPMPRYNHCAPVSHRSYHAPASRLCAPPHGSYQHHGGGHHGGFHGGHHGGHHRGGHCR